MNKYQAVIFGFGKAGKTLAVTLAKAGSFASICMMSNERVSTGNHHE